MRGWGNGACEVGWPRGTTTPRFESTLALAGGCVTSETHSPSWAFGFSSLTQENTHVARVLSEREQSNERYINTHL